VDRWADPASQVVASEKDSFQPVAALLKAWSVPFDIFRLDQQTFGAGYLFERSGRVRYGAVVWLADASSYANKNMAVLAEAAAAGTSLMAVASRFQDPALEQILGLKSKRTTAPPIRLRLTRAFHRAKLREQRPRTGSLAPALGYAARRAGTARAGQASRRDRASAQSGHCRGLMAAPLAALRDSPYWRSIFARWCGAWGTRYADVNYAHSILLMCDDRGAADNRSCRIGATRRLLKS
jgi:hypothetical protein